MYHRSCLHPTFLAMAVWLMTAMPVHAQEPSRPIVDWQKTDFSRPVVKSPFLSEKKHKTWPWIAGGAAVAGTVVLLALPDDEGEPPVTPGPTAVDDYLSAPCAGSASVNVLANDSGDGLTVSAFGPVNGATVTHGANGVLLISQIGPSSFSFPYTVRNAGGKTATATVHVSVSDNQSPSITCPPNLTLTCNAPTDPAATGLATATDACSETSVTHSDDAGGLSGCNQTGTLVRTWTATDAAQNAASCSQTIAVQDTEAPVWTNCPPNITVVCGQENNLSLTGQATASDLCGETTVAYTDDLTNLNNCEGFLVRSWTATDACGNTAGPCMQTITVLATPCDFTIDAVPEPASCPTPGDIVVNINGLTDSLYTVVVTGPVTITLPDQLPGEVQLGTLVNVVPGTYTIEVFSSLGCSQTTVIDVPYLPPYEFFILQVTNPSCPTCDDGSVQFQTGATALFPLMLFVNGNPIGLAGANPFTIGNLLPGVYTFQVVDNGGNGCPSASLTVVLEAMVAHERAFAFLGVRRTSLPMPMPAIQTTAVPEHPPAVQTAWASSYQTVVGVFVPVSPTLQLWGSVGAGQGVWLYEKNSHPVSGSVRQNTLGIRWNMQNHGSVQPYLDGSVTQWNLSAGSPQQNGTSQKMVGASFTPGMVWNVNRHVFLQFSCSMGRDVGGTWRWGPDLFFGLR